MVSLSSCPCSLTKYWVFLARTKPSQVEETVRTNGTLWQGTKQIKRLKDLPRKPAGGRPLHEVTLVIGSSES